MSDSTAATAVIEMPCLGRPFQLGMLYNCHTEQLIPGKTLWGPEALNKVVQKKPQLSSDFEVIAEDSLSEKTSRLEVSGNLKLSLLGGLVSAGGAAKYFNDQKSSKNQARVSLKYKTTSAYEQLTMEQLGQIEYPDVFDDGIATHVVTAVLYGADAFFVFDRAVAKDENYRKIHGSMEVLIKSIPGITGISGNASADIQDNEGSAVEKFQCKFYGDFILPENPSTFQDACKIYQELPSLLGRENSTKSVPKKVWLLPLSNLDSRGQRITRAISVGLVTDVEKLLEDLHEFEMQSSDIIKNGVCSHFLGIKDKLHRVQELISGYRLELMESLATLLPRIRGGGAEEVELTDVLKVRNQSPFSHECLSSWISGKENEVKLLAGFMNKIQEQQIQLAFAPSEMDVLISDFDVEKILCFDFNIAARVDSHLQKMDAHLRKVAAQECSSPNPWYKSQTLMRDMRLQLRLFMGFVKANAGSNDIQYVVTDSSTEATTESSQVAVVTLYVSGIETKFEIPDKPGKPQAEDVTHCSLQLKWSKPKHGAQSVQSYTVFYRPLDDPQDNWLSIKASGVQEDLVFSRLASETIYFFKIQAETAAGISPESEISDPIQTKAPPIRKIEPGCKIISKLDEHPVIHQLPLQGRKKQGSLVWCTVGKPLYSSTAPVPHKVLMVVGATGAGKSTLINGMVNYIFGVRWEDDHRYKLITEHDEGGISQAHSQTKCITSYTFHHKKGSPLPYTLTVIDTPGFGDTEGLERDKKLVRQIKELFSTRETGTDQLNGIGFVVQASLARLTHTQKYIFDAVLSIFGKDIESNIFLMTTFADGKKPPVLEAVKTAGIPHQDHFKFNNSALFADKSGEDEFAQMFWKMGTKSFDAFFKAFARVDARSLQLTREVLAEREQLEIAIQGLQPQIRAGLSKMDELRQEEQVLNRREAEIRTNKDFTYEIDVTKQRKVKLPTGTYTTNCLICNFTCHDDCAYANDLHKYKCSAMGINQGTPKACCTACPGVCSWKEHVNNPYKFEIYQAKEVRTSTDLKRKYESAVSGKGQVEAMITKSHEELEATSSVVLNLIRQAKRSISRLEEIALRSNPLTEVGYIDILIRSEEQEARPGFLKRIEALQKVREQARLMSELKHHKQVFGLVPVQRGKSKWEYFAKLWPWYSREKK